METGQRNYLQRHVHVLTLQPKPPGRILNMTQLFVPSEVERIADDERSGSCFLKTFKAETWERYSQSNTKPTKPSIYSSLRLISYSKTRLSTDVFSLFLRNIPKKVTGSNAPYQTFFKDTSTEVKERVSSTCCILL